MLVNKDITPFKFLNVYGFVWSHYDNQKHNVYGEEPGLNRIYIFKLHHTLEMDLDLLLDKDLDTELCESEPDVSRNMQRIRYQNMSLERKMWLIAAMSSHMSNIFMRTLLFGANHMGALLGKFGLKISALVLNATNCGTLVPFFTFSRKLTSVPYFLRFTIDVG